MHTSSRTTVIGFVEDFDFGADKIINFETTLSDLLREKFRYEILVFSTIQVLTMF